MAKPETLMAADIRSTPDVIAQQEKVLAGPLRDLILRLHRLKPSLVVTCARGSSAHVATLGKHMIERYIGLPVAEAAPSISSIYRRRLMLNNQLLLAISQSGRSDDLIAFAADAKGAGALTVAITNAPDSPLASVCEVVLPLAAGPERSVAATKTFMATAAAIMRLVGAWAVNLDLERAVCRLPARLHRVSELDWSAAQNVLSHAAHLVVLGRGPTLAIAREAALKLKEVCAVHAEAYSAAEFLHGPVALIRPGYPVLALTPADEGAQAMRALCRELHTKGASLLEADSAGEGILLPLLPAEQPEADALCLLQRAYFMIVHVAKQLGADVDHPPHLVKVTRTR